MLQEKISGNFIADRVDEIIYSTISNDREEFIEEIIKQFKEYQDEINQKQMTQMKNFSDKIESLSNMQKENVAKYSKQIQALKRKNEDLANENRILRGKAASFSLDNDPTSPTYNHSFCKIDITSLKSQFHQIKKQIQSYRKAVDNIFYGMKNLISEFGQESHQEIIKKKNELEEILNNMKMHYEDEVLPQIKEKSEQTIRQIKTDCLDKNNKIKNLQIKLKELNSKNDALRKQINLNVTTINQMKEEKELNQKKNKSKEKQYQEKVNLLENEKTNLNKRLDSLEKEKKELRNKLYMLENEKINLNEKLNSLDNERKSLLKKLNIMEKDQNNLHEEVNVLEDEKKNLLDKLNTIEKERNDLHEKIDSLENDKNDLLKKINSIENEKKNLHEKIKLIENEKNYYHKDITSLQEEKKNLQNKLISLENNKNNLQKDLISLEDEKSKLNKKISFVEEKNNELQEKINFLEIENNNLQKELNNKTEEIDNLNKSLNEQKENIESLQQNNLLLKNQNDEIENKNKELESKLSDIENEKENLEIQLENSNIENQTNRNSISSLNDMNKQTNDLLHEANEKIYSLEDELTKSNSNIDVLEEKLSEQNQKMSNLINEQNNELKKKDEEIQELTIKNEQLIKAINEEEDKNTKASLEIQNYEQFKNQLETILPIKTENNEEMIQCIESLVDDSNNLSSISNYLKIPSKSEILDTVKVLNENIEFINNAVQESSKETIEDFVNDSLKKKQEEKEIAQLMNIDTIDSLPKIIDDLLKEKTESQRKLTEASQFTSKIFGIISSSPQTNLRFPLPTNIQQTVIDIVTSLQRNSAKNQEDVENVLQQAKSLGYEGSDCIEACDFMTNEIMESKKRLDKINDLKKEISEIKKEKDKSDSETLNLKNKIKDMKKIVVHQQIEAAKREEEINESLMEYEQKIKDLNEDLITERRIREQLSRIGAGFSADSQFLRSKLSENEVRLVEFVEKMMNQEKQTSLIHERQRKTREKLFGSTST